MLLAVSFAALVGSGNAPSLSALLDGGAFVRDDRTALHVNGTSGDVDTNFSDVDCPAGDRCGFEQRDHVTVFVNYTKGAAQPIDAASLRVGAKADLGAKGDQLLVVTGGGRTYSIARSTGIVTVLDTELAEIGRVDLGGPADDAVVDRNGRLFVSMPARGEVIIILGPQEEKVLTVATPR